MAGIFAFTGSVPCKKLTENALVSLAGRGDELAGIVLAEEELQLTKIKGSPGELCEKTATAESSATTALAQCKNASRCKASNLTAVPCANRDVAAALDGSIANFYELKKHTVCPFPIATDEDLLLALLCASVNDDRLEMIRQLDGILTGNPTYAFLVKGEEAVYFRVGACPLLLGTGKNGSGVSSELSPLLAFAEKTAVLKEGDRGKITKDKIVLTDKNGKKCKPALQTPSLSCPAVTDATPFEELFYAPLAAKRTLSAFMKGSTLRAELLPMSRRGIDKLSRILLIGDGSSCSLAELIAFHFKLLTDIPCCAYPSGEVRYSGELFNKSTLLIAVSDSGESADTCYTVRRAKDFGTRTIAVTNQPLSLLARLADTCLCPNGDITRGEASLRGFIALQLTLSLLALSCGRKSGVVSELYLNVCLRFADMLPGCIASASRGRHAFEYTAGRILACERVYCAGIGADAALAKEAARKLTALCGVPCSGVSLFELAEYHESALDEAVILALITNREFAPPALTLLRRLRARGCELLLFTTEATEEEIPDFEGVISFADSVPLFNGIPCLAALYKIGLCAREILNGEKEETLSAI